VTLGEKVKQLRLKRRWTQDELAKRAQVRAPLVSELESNKKLDTTGSVLRRLAWTLGVSIDYLVGVYDALGEPRQPQPQLTEEEERERLSRLRQLVLDEDTAVQELCSGAEEREKLQYLMAHLQLSAADTLRALLHAARLPADPEQAQH